MFKEYNKEIAKLSELITNNDHETIASILDSLSVGKALKKVRKDAASKETIYYIYFVDNDMHFLGFIFLKELVLADLQSSIISIMETTFVYAEVFEDQESVAKKN